ncbi:MAG TPA: hypothetical protein VGE93_10420, partial [Bryobacteraceae bacterium]
VYLSREFDGYPAATGADIVFALSSYPLLPTDFLRGVLSIAYAPEPESVGQPVYELAENVDRRTEWFYCIRFNGVSLPGVSIACARRTPDQTAVEVFNAISPTSYETVHSFIKRVNADRQQINRHRVALKQQNPEAYSDLSLYSELKLPH